MKNNYFLKTAFTFILCGLFSFSYAATPIYLAATGGNDAYNGSSSGLAVATLAQAMTLVDADGTIIVSGMVSVTSETTLTKNVTIQGTSNTSDGFTGNSTARFISNAAFNLTLSNLKLTTYAATAGNGGVLLLSGGTVNINNINFDNNKALLGGALYVSAGTVTLDGCKIQNNDNTTITGSKGGAIYVLPTAIVSLNVKNTLIKNNKTTAEGGAIYYLDATNAFASTMRFTNCALVSNTTGGTTLGAGAYINNATSTATVGITFINTTFYDNAAGGTSGGAMLVSNLRTGSVIDLRNCTITGNKVLCNTLTGTAIKADAGAGIRLLTAAHTNGGVMKIYNSILENNYCPTAAISGTTYTTDFVWQTDAFTAGTNLIIENSMICRPMATAKYTVVNFPTSKLNYLVVSADVRNSYLAKFGTFNTTDNYLPLLSGSFALSYGLKSHLASLSPSITSDQIGTMRAQTTVCDAGAIEEIRIAALTPPTLTADATDNTVENNINITYTSDPTWLALITSVKVGGTALTVTTDYVISDGNIQLKPSGLNTLLTTSGSKSITVVSTGYYDAIVSQDILAGVATKLSMKRQPTAPASNGANLATQPQLYFQDLYSNNTTSADNVTASVGAGSWTIGGTFIKPIEVTGYVSYVSLSATSTSAVKGATITFTSGSLTPVTSAAFDIPAPPSTTPSAPTDIVATRGDTQISVAFTEGANGGLDISNYEYSTDGGTTFTPCAPAQTVGPIVITGLTNGNAYTAIIKAVNANGAGAASVASNSVTPSIVSGLKNVDNQSISILKNSNNQIVIKNSSTKSGSVIICNTLGQIILSTTLNGTATTINKSLNSGVYLVLVNIDGKSKSTKIIL